MPTHLKYYMKFWVDATPVEKTHPNEHVNGSNVSVGNGNPDCNVSATEQLPGASKKHQAQQPTVSISVTEADGEKTLDKLVSDDISKKDILEDDAKNKECPTNPKDDTCPTTDNEINSPVVSNFRKMINNLILILFPFNDSDYRSFHSWILGPVKDQCKSSRHARTRTNRKQK